LTTRNRFDSAAKLIDHLNIKGFKSFENVDLSLGALNFFIGTNSSGKSNLFDALRVLQGIGCGLRVDEIFNGKSDLIHCLYQSQFVKSRFFVSTLPS
jgi:AAA15 family ATPase/GTPase